MKRLKKILLALLALALLAGVSQVQKSMNRDRAELGLTRVEPLENAPPMLAFTTVALGGFRGLISNMLWIRASDLQDQDKVFEMVQLADWITKLEPHFVQVWVHQAWNMAYNVSVKFKDFSDRWRWVQRGIELLRDEGLKYNPNELLIYRELSWFFQHKIGATVDDAHNYYKLRWGREMEDLFGRKPNFDELINPTTSEQKERVGVLRGKYKLDPVFMKHVDETYGPLEWRLPEAHAIYWAALGLQKARENPDKVKPDEIITVRRSIYQSMLVSFQRGRLEENPFDGTYELTPNLDIIPNVNRTYETMMEEDVSNREHIGKAHRNFLRDAVYFLYVNNRLREASQWFEYLKEQYPNKPILDSQLARMPASFTLDEYAVGRVQEDTDSISSRERTTAIIRGLIGTSYRSLVVGEDERSVGYLLLAQKVWEAYQVRVPEDRMPALGLTSFDEMKRDVLMRILDPERGAVPEMRAVLRTKLGMPPERPSGATNSAPTSVNRQ